ncbi:MAG: hybrid sensor histidine kinase/response regulator, partial [Planctomycetota bacterium]
TLANRRACEILGYGEETELIGRVWFDRFLPEAIRRGARRALTRLMAGDLNAMKPTVSPLLTRSGQKHLVSWRSVPIRDDGGSIVGVVSSGTDVTDLKLAEAALRTSEERYRRVFENAQEGISVHEVLADGSRKLVDCNEAYAKMSGHSREQLFAAGDVRRLQRSLGPPAERERILGLAADRQPHGGSFTWLRPDGRDNRFENTTSYFRAGPEAFAVAVDRDVTEQREAEEAVRRSESRYRGVYDTAPLAFVLWDSRCLVTDWNRRAEEVFGWRREEVLGKNFFEFLIPEGSRPEMEAVVAGLLRGEVARNVVNQNLTKSGQVITCEWSNAVLFDGRGNVEGVISLALDISDRMRIEEALRDSEARYRMVFENAHEGISIHEMLPGGAKKLIDCNDRYAQIAGRSREELLATGDVTSLQVSRLPDEAEEQIREEAEVGAAHSGAMSWKRPDGRPNCVEYTCGFLEAGGRRFAVGIDRDVTERRRAREETRALEDRLRQGEKMQAIGELAGGVAHDFNNQLAAIMGCAEMLQRKLGDDALARYADIIVKACARAADVTGQLLAFARKGKLRTAPVNVHAVVDEVVALLEHSIDKRIRVRRKLRATRPTVMGDPTQLQNALLNIAINARDAMPDGGYLTFASESADLGEEEILALPYQMDPGPYVRVSISDTGVGMDARTRKHIFEPFFTTKQVGKGTGMGLAAVYGTVKSHRGAIEVESAPGKGSTFSVLLPVGEPDESGGDAGDEAPLSRRAACVLVVDDEELVREAATGMLGELGYEAIACATGKEAAGIYAERWREIDVVLLDMVMPAMNGAETFAALREINPDVKAVLSSGYSLDGEAQQLLEDGAVSFVQKPYRAADLAAQLSAALEV